MNFTYMKGSPRVGENSSSYFPYGGWCRAAFGTNGGYATRSPNFRMRLFQRLHFSQEFQLSGYLLQLSVQLPPSSSEFLALRF